MVELREVVGSILSSILGPNKNNKFLIQDKDVCMARCPLVIFQNVHFQDPISSLVEETLFAHHELYGCSTLSLLAMWYLWNEEFRLAIDNGCEIQDIIKHSQNILEQVISAISATTLNFNTMISKKQTLSGKINTNMTVSNKVPKPIQYSSRHFSPAAKALELENDYEGNKCFDQDENSLNKAIQSLDHDENIEICDLVFKCWKRQASSFGCSKFNADDIFICPMLLPTSSSMVVDGLVLKSFLNDSWCHDRENICSNRSLLIKNSITYEYTHLGFSPKVEVSVDQTSLATKKKIWIEDICKFIRQLNLDFLLIKDDVEPEIATFCLAHSVLVFTHIPLIPFKKLCNVLQYSPCTYIRDSSEADILKNLTIKLWKPDDITLKDQYFIISIDHTKTVLQTIVLCHPSKAVLETIEHQTHHLIYRLSLSFENNLLLPGGGKSEQWGCEFLNKLPQFQDLSDPISRIMKALANGLKNYAIIISKKKSLCINQEVEILDEASSKLKAWRSALSLLLLTLQCDSVIINGTIDLNVQNLCIDTL